MDIKTLPLVNITRAKHYDDLGGEDYVAGLGNRTQEASNATSPRSGSTTSFPDDTFTVQEAVDAIGFGWFQIKLSLLTGLAWMADSMEMMILSILAPALHCSWNLSGWQQAVLTTVVFAGMMVSSGYWGKLCDKYGRKTELIMCSSFTFYFGILSSFAPSFLWMLILRGLVGFGIGGAPQSITLYAEFLPTAARARCILMIEIFWALGACFEVGIALFVMPSLGWRWLLAFSSFPLLVFTILCFWLPESARYDAARGHTDAAIATLRRIANENNKPMPLGELRESVLVSSQIKRKRGQMRDLFAPSLRWTTVLLWFIWLANAFSYYGIVLMTTELFETEDGCHGSVDSPDNQEIGSCAARCKVLTFKDYTDLLWTTIAEFPGLFVTLLIIECLGRRKTMAIELILFSIFVFLVNICTTRTVLTVFLFISRAFVSGGFQAAYLYTPEVYPTATRALGLGTCSGMARIGAIITPFVAQVILKISTTLTICLYGSICLLAGVACLLLPYETAGKQLAN